MTESSVPGPVEMLGRRPSPPSRPASADRSGEGTDREPVVLLVDDERDALEAMAELLADEGFECRQARNGREALDLLADWRPALILLDIKMPVMDGREFLRQLSAHPEFSDIPVAIMTASASPAEIPLRTRDAGYFHKPVDYERLLETVRFYCR